MLVDRRYLRCEAGKNNQTFAYVVSESIEKVGI